MNSTNTVYDSFEDALNRLKPMCPTVGGFEASLAHMAKYSKMLGSGQGIPWALAKVEME